MKRLNSNAGFSLVELIVVIAIMAVLVGITAPQYIRYVEKSRIQKVISNTKTVADGINVALTDAAAFETGVYDTLLQLASSQNPLNLESDAAAFLRDAINEDISGSVTFYRTADNTISFTYTMSDGRLAVDYNYTDSSHDYISEEGSYHVYYSN